MANLSRKSILCVCSALFFLLAASCSKGEALALSVGGEPAGELAAAQSGTLMAFRFSAAQRQAAREFYDGHDGGALEVQLRALKFKATAAGDASPFELGFLYDDDADVRNLSSRPLVTGVLKRFGSAPICLVFSFEHAGRVPAGFFVRSGDKIAVDFAAVVSAAVGFDYTGDVPVFAFAANGGAVSGSYDIRTYAVDFSGASLSFNSVPSGTAFSDVEDDSSEPSPMPELVIAFDKDAVNRDPVKISIGGERLTIRPVLGGQSVIPFAALKSPFSALTVVENEEEIASIMLRAPGASRAHGALFAPGTRFVLTPITTDPGLIMDWKMANWRGKGYELFVWDKFPGVLIFDIADYDIQNDFFRRLAYFAEKSGYRGRLLSDEELAGMHGYNAHDYNAENLAAFFEKARTENFPLNEKERLLRQILIENGVITLSPNGAVLAGQGGVISISQKSPGYLRTQFMAHEGWHGIFFVNEEFRNTVASIYYLLDAQTRDYLIRYFQVTPTLNYDVNDDYLMKNEFMAYMIQQPVANVAKYFVNMASREHSQQLAKRQADYIIQTGAAGFVSAATMLDEYVNSEWNFNAGRAWSVSR